MRKLEIPWDDFESAITDPWSGLQGYVDGESGAVLVVSDAASQLLQELLADNPNASVEEVIAHADVHDWEKDELRTAARVERRLGETLLDVAELDLRETHRDLREFAATVRDDAMRRRLEKAIAGPGAFRRFRDLIHASFHEREHWFAFQRQRRGEKAAAWLASHGIEVTWVLSGREAKAARPVREHLLEGVLKFTRTAAQLPGISRIALLGSLTHAEPNPKDADVLVTVTDDTDLTPLAKAGRQLAGHSQQVNRGADVFLANERGEYIGRTCHWRHCAPGVRASCDAMHCGRRPYLHDDLKSIRLAPSVVGAPPIELWPRENARVTPPGGRGTPPPGAAAHAGGVKPRRGRLSATRQRAAPSTPAAKAGQPMLPPAIHAACVTPARVCK